MMENKGAAGRTSLACKVKICLKILLSDKSF